MRVKWETLKEKAIREAMGYEPAYTDKLAPWALLAGIGDGTFDWKNNVQELRDKVIKVIEYWDIRRAKALIDLFPGIVPQRYVGKVPVCYVADTPNADWIVEFEEYNALDRA